MQQPLQITFRNMEKSEALEDSIKKWVAKLEKTCPDLISCRVVVEAPRQHKQTGNKFHTRIELALPGHEIAVNREPPAHHGYVDVYVSIRDAFENARRQLSECGRRKQGQVKTHETPAVGRISALHATGDYGTIETTDGREFEFYRNSLLTGDFDKLEIGDEVRFEEKVEMEGLRASSVRLIGKHHPA